MGSIGYLKQLGMIFYKNLIQDYSGPHIPILHVWDDFFDIFVYLHSDGYKKWEDEIFYLITAQERCTIQLFLTVFYLLGYGNWVLFLSILRANKVHNPNPKSIKVKKEKKRVYNFF